MAEDAPRVCFDRILPRDLNRPRDTRAVGVFRKFWMNGSTLQVRFLEGTSAQQSLVQEQAAWWTEHANINFNFNNAPDAEIRIAFNSRDGAWSFMGTDCLSIPQNQPTMNLGFMDGGTTAHEFGHTLGLGHEHQNPDGGIEWNRDAVIRSLSGPPNSWDLGQIEHNVLNKYSEDQIRGTEFDPDSIMLYFFPDAWVLNGPGTKENETLSALDKAFVSGPQAYPGRVSDGPVKLTVGDGSGESASIGEPGEEDQFVFTARTSGRYVIETSGQTDVVMKLFGPNSQTRLIAEDDDGGLGFNSRISANLLPGDYFVQIRHYNTARGTGDYQIKVAQ